jgi:hypothetical protein
MQGTKLQLTKLQAYAALGLTFHEMDGNWYVTLSRLSA